MDSEHHTVVVTVNGRRYKRSIEARRLLSDFIRHDLLLAGTHVGCEQGACGACTVLFDGLPARACLMFAAQADGHSIETVEGLAPDAEHLHPLQQAMHEKHGLQCGYCTPGILMSAKAFLADTPTPTEAELRDMLTGHLCRCTGYEHIVDALLLAAERMQPASEAKEA